MPEKRQKKVEKQVDPIINMKLTVVNVNDFYGNMHFEMPKTPQKKKKSQTIFRRKMVDSPLINSMKCEKKPLNKSTKTIDVR